MIGCLKFFLSRSVEHIVKKMLRSKTYTVLLYCFICLKGYLKCFVVSRFIRDEIVTKGLRRQAKELLALFLETLDPLVVRHVNDAKGENQPPVELVTLDAASLATVHSIVLILNLHRRIKFEF